MVLGLGIFSVTVLGILVSRYPSYVESRFQDTLEKLGIAARANVSSICLGVKSDRIQILPVLYSRVFNRDPFPSAVGRRSNYKHGQRFNYQKLIDYGRRDGYVRLSAYWSVRENRWHAGGIVKDNTWQSFWQCVPGICPLKEHTGRSGDEHLVQYESTLGSLFSDFNSPNSPSNP